MANDAVLKALAVTAELCGANISEAAAKVIVADLSMHDDGIIILALEKMRREHEGRFTLAAINRFIAGAVEQKKALERPRMTCCECNEPATQGSYCPRHANFHATLKIGKPLSDFLPALRRAN